MLVFHSNGCFICVNNMDWHNWSCSFSGLSRQPFVQSKTLALDIYLQTVPPDSLVPAVLVDTIDLHYFIPPSVTLALAEGEKDSKKK